MMNNVRNKVNQFMRGRYGADVFGMFLVICALLLNLIESFTRVYVLSFISLGILIYASYRMLSKNIVKRRIENDKYNEIVTIMKRYWKVFKSNLTDKRYRYYLCPTCHQMVRVPKGHGKVTITCPNCRNKFEKRS